MAVSNLSGSLILTVAVQEKCAKSKMLTKGLFCFPTCQRTECSNRTKTPTSKFANDSGWNTREVIYVNRRSTSCFVVSMMIQVIVKFSCESRCWGHTFDKFDIKIYNLVYAYTRHAGWIRFWLKAKSLLASIPNDPELYSWRHQLEYCFVVLCQDGERGAEHDPVI